jgi:hypothetical protein
VRFCSCIPYVFSRRPEKHALVMFDLRQNPFFFMSQFCNTPHVISDMMCSGPVMHQHRAEKNDLSFLSPIGFLGCDPLFC